MASIRWNAKVRSVAVGVLAAILLASGCAPGSNATRDPSTPPEGVPVATETVEKFATGLEQLDMTGVSLSVSPADVTTELKTIFAGMDGITPEVTVNTITYTDDGSAATAELTLRYPLDVEGWSYTTTAPLENVDGSWIVTWSPSVVHPQLTAESRLRHQRKQPKRAAINDRDGVALVEERPMFHIGIDKSQVAEAEWATAAAQLAALVEIDAAAYTEKVLAGGAQQYVIAVTVSQDAIPATVTEIPGAMVQDISMVVPPSPTFARSILGTVGTPNEETIAKANGAIDGSDVVGVSGLQARYDEQLRGVPEIRIDLVARSGQTFEEQNLFHQQSSVGQPIDLSLDRELQTKAEAVLANHIPEGEIGAIVVLDVTDGGVLAAANSTGAGEYPYATYGSFAPGSTFKIVSSLAMIRNGATANSTVECPSSITIGSHVVSNYSGYPAAGTGSVTLADAVKYSCNTVFAAAAKDITPEQLQSAAASLGVGTDYDAGFTSNFGTVAPDAADPIGRAIAMIGQGGIEMSPLAMASVSASVASGKTTIPWLVKGHEATSTATPLTEQEAAELQTLMKGAVNMAGGVMTGGKTGTAEYGADASGSDAHAWMITWNDKYAVAAFVEKGDSGSGTAGPMIVELFSES